MKPADLPGCTSFGIWWTVGRKTDLYTAYDKTIKELELPLMKTFIPDTNATKRNWWRIKRRCFAPRSFPPAARW